MINDRKHEPGCFIIELWPSVSELAESKCENAYLGNLTEFYESYDRLMEQLTRQVPTDAYTDGARDAQRPRRGHDSRGAPNPVIEEEIATVNQAVE
jgi:hypothetical protein